MFQRIAIVNRGEAAMRLIHAVRDLNAQSGPDGHRIETVALHTTAERSAMFVREADGAVIATEWNQFRALDLDRLKSLLSQPLLVDLRNLYEPARVAAAGLRYVSIGRPEEMPR